MDVSASYPATWGAFLSLVAIGYALAGVVGIARAARRDPAWALPARHTLPPSQRSVMPQSFGMWILLLALCLQGIYVGIECLQLTISPFESSGLSALLLSAMIAGCVVVRDIWDRSALTRSGQWVFLIAAAVSGTYGVVQTAQPHMTLIDAVGGSSFWIQGAVAGQLIVAVCLTISAVYSAAALTIPSTREGAAVGELLDEQSFRAVSWAVPPGILAVLCHMIWDQNVAGVIWSAAAGETWALLAVAYTLIYLHLWSRRGWRGSRIALLGMAGLIGALAPIVATGAPALVI